MIACAGAPPSAHAVGGGHESMVAGERQALGAQLRQQAHSSDGTNSPAAQRAIRKGNRLLERARDQDSGRHDQYLRAIKLSDKALKDDPTSPDAYTGLAQAYIATGRYEVALQACENSFAYRSTNYLAVRLRGEALMGLNRTADARFAFDALQRAGETDHLDALREVMTEWITNAQQSGDVAADTESFITWFRQTRSASQD